MGNILADSRKTNKQYHVFLFNDINKTGLQPPFQLFFN